MANPFINQTEMEQMLPEQIQIMRRQQLAQQLVGQGQEPLQGQMISGHYVSPSWTQQLAKGLQTYYGNKGLNEASQQQQDLAQQLKDQRSSEMGQFAQLLQGRPADQPLAEGEQGPVRPAQGPDVAGAYKFAANAQTPALQQFGMQGMLTQAQQQQMLEQQNQLRQRNAALWQSVGGDPQKFLLAGGDPTIAKSLAEAPMMGRDEGVVINGQLVGKKTGQRIGETVPQQANPFSDLVIPDPNRPGAYIQNAPLVGAKTQIANAGRNLQNTVVSVAGPENKFNQDVGAGLAKDALDLVNAAKSAPDVVRNARSIKAALDAGAITGTGADTRLAVQKALETAGIVGPGKAASTQELMAGLGKLTLSGIKTSGLGGGNGFTDKDREFLNAAISGQIADTPANLRRVADLSERQAVLTHQKGTQILQNWKNNKALSSISGDVTIDQIPQQSTPAKPGWSITPVQ